MTKNQDSRSVNNVDPRSAKASVANWIRQLPWLSIFIVAAALALSWAYWERTRLPESITIAGGPENGRYAQLARGVAEELERRFDITVKVLQTKGSLENLHLLESHQVDFAFYQPGTRLILEGHETSERAAEPATFVSNLYPEFLIPVAPAIENVPDFSHVTDRIWCSNDHMSGDYAVTKLLLEHLQLDESQVEVKSVSYVDLPDAVKSGRINIGILCCGLRAPILKDVLVTHIGKLVPIPSVDALSRKHAALRAEVIPAGYFQTYPPVPAMDYKTVALRAQLLASTRVSVRLAEEVTRIVADARFQRRFGLTELFAGGTEYATDRPEYELHPGAANVFYPGLKPLLNPDFVEGTEGLRSFIVSFIAAAWLLRRWWVGRKLRSQEHRLDRYIRELLELERAQIDVDGDRGDDDTQSLQQMLDRVTRLRQEALAEFTAHELNEDRAVDCFVEMCHALSDKINAKLTRAAILKITTR